MPIPSNMGVFQPTLDNEEYAYFSILDQYMLTKQRPTDIKECGFTNRNASHNINSDP